MADTRNTSRSARLQNAPGDFPFRQIVMLLSLPLLAWVLWQLRLVIALSLLSLLLAVGLAPILGALERRRMPRPLAIALVYAGILGPIIGIFLWAGRIVVAESQGLAARFLSLLDAWQKLAAGNPFVAPPDSAYRLFSSFSSNSLRAASNSLVLLAAGLLVLVIAYYLLAEREKLWVMALGLVPARYRRMVDLLGQEIAARIQGYSRGILINAFVIGAATGIGLLLLGVPYPLFFAILAGILEVVPMVGPVIAAVGPILLALGQSPLRAGLVLLFFVVLQQVEDKVLVVRIQSSATGLHPLTVIYSMLIMGVLFGLTGMLLAVPVAAALQACAVCLTSCFLHPDGATAWLAEREAAYASEAPISSLSGNRVGKDGAPWFQEDANCRPVSIASRSEVEA